MDTMKKVVVTGVKKAELVDVPIPQAKEDCSGNVRIPEDR